MIEQILYQILGVAVIVTILVFLWWAHVYGKETKRIWREVEESIKRREKLTRNGPPSSKREFNPGTYLRPWDTPTYNMVFCDGNGILVLPEVMLALELVHGQSVSQDVAMSIAILNGGIMKPRLDAQLAKKKEADSV